MREVFRVESFRAVNPDNRKATAPCSQTSHLHGYLDSTRCVHLVVWHAVYFDFLVVNFQAINRHLVEQSPPVSIEPAYRLCQFGALGIKPYGLGIKAVGLLLERLELDAVARLRPHLDQLCAFDFHGALVVYLNFFFK